MKITFNNSFQFAPLQGMGVSTVLKGGEWLIRESSAFETFIPEDFSEEQMMIRDMCEQFFGYGSNSYPGPH